MFKKRERKVAENRAKLEALGFGAPAAKPTKPPKKKYKKHVFRDDSEFAAPPRRSAAAATPPRDGKNFLHGHRFLTKAEFDDEGERATRDAVAALAATPAYAAWLAENHGRLTVAWMVG